MHGKLVDSPNAPDQRPGADDPRLSTRAPSPGSQHLACSTHSSLGFINRHAFCQRTKSASASLEPEKQIQVFKHDALGCRNVLGSPCLTVRPRILPASSRSITNEWSCIAHKASAISSWHRCAPQGAPSVLGRGFSDAFRSSYTGSGSCFSSLLGKTFLVSQVMPQQVGTGHFSVHSLRGRVWEILPSEDRWVPTHSYCPCESLMHPNKLMSPPTWPFAERTRQTACCIRGSIC